MAVMSHELRTPLTAVMGYAELLHDGIVGPINSEQKNFAFRIMKSAEHQVSMIDDIMDFAAIEAGKLVVKPQVTNVIKAVTDAVSLVEPLLRAKNLAFDVEAPNSLLATTDPARVKQVLVNLLTNATKFTDHGSVTLEVETHGDKMVFRVTDTGVGISEANQDKIFEKFWQVSQGTTRTVGGGNHYVDVFVDEEGYVWVGVHFGSRGLGHNIAMGFNALAGGYNWGERVAEREGLLSLQSILGQDYWELMHLAGDYAYAGREWVANTVVKILGGKQVDLVHNNHNFAWREKHYIVDDDYTDEVIVVRKGATPAFPGQRGFIGGSMGDDAVIVEGALDGGRLSPFVMKEGLDDYPEPVGRVQERAMYSTVHGAGRVMSRTEAKGKRNRKTGELKLDADGNAVKPPKITEQMMDEWLKERGVIRRGGEVDEAPQAYRRLPDVLAAQGNTVNVLHTLKPVIVVMAGSDVFDPYRD